MPADNHSAETASPKRDDDSPWKEALDRLFPEFLALLFPSVHAETLKGWKFRLIRLMYADFRVQVTISRD